MAAPQGFSHHTTRRRFIAGIIAASVVVACGRQSSNDSRTGAASSTSDPDATRRFVDVTGHSVEVPDVATRIVATNDQNAGAQLLSLGAPVVGIASRDGIIDPAISEFFDTDDIALVGEHFEPNIEKIASLRPDLIVHEGYAGEITLDPGVRKQLEELAPVVGIDAFRPIEEYMADHAALLGGDAVTTLEAQQSEFATHLDSLRSVLDDEWSEVTGSLFVMNSGSLEVWEPTAIGPSDILDRLGVTWIPLMEEAALPENGGYISGISLEQIPEFSADLLLVDTAFGGDQLLEHPLFERLPAAEAGQVVELDSRQADGHYPGFIAIAELLRSQLEATPLRTDIV